MGNTYGDSTPSNNLHTKFSDHRSSPGLRVDADTIQLGHTSWKLFNLVAVEVGHLIWEHQET